MKPEVIAEVAHEVNRAYCASLGDLSTKPWAKLSAAQRAGMVAGVEYHTAHPDSTPQQQHEAWLAARTAEGWTHGDKKDEEAKTHPALVPYDQLPQEQRSKDWIFKMVVTQLAALPDVGVTPALPAALPAAAANQRLPVKYVGHKGNRPTHKDTLYGTEIVWAYGQTILVPAPIARTMVEKHPEVYAWGDAGAAEPAAEATASNKKAEEDAEFQRRQDEIDGINAMTTKKAITEYVKLHYRQDLDANLKVGDLKQAAVNLVHQFGVQ